MLFFNNDEPGHVSATMFRYRWPFWVVVLYVMGMACTEAICHPPPLLFNNRISISEPEITSQLSWPAPIIAPNDLINEITVPDFVNTPDVISPATDDYKPPFFGQKENDWGHR